MVRRVTVLLVLALGLIGLAAGCQGKLSTIHPTATSIEFATAQAATQLALRPTDTPTLPPTKPLPTRTPTEIPPTETATAIPPTLTPTMTLTLTPDMTGTALAEFYATQAAADVAGTLTALPSSTPYPTYTVAPSLTAVPSLTASRTPLPTFTPITDRTATAAAANTREAIIAGAVEATVTALPTGTPYATYTPQPTYTRPPSSTPYPTYTVVPSLTASHTPSPTFTPTADRTATVAAANTREAVIAGAVEATVAALPSSTPYPTYTLVPSLTASRTPLPTFTPTADRTATAAALNTREAVIAGAVEATVAALPTGTPYATYTPQPTYTRPPSSTPYPTFTLPPTHTASPTYTPSPNVIATVLAQTAQAAQTHAPTETSQAATRIAGYVEGTLTALPSATFTPSNTPTRTPVPSPTRTPLPTSTPMLVPSNTPTRTLVPSATRTALPTSTPSITPSLTPTAVPPTAAVTLAPSPTGPTPDLFATATAQAAATGTLSPGQLTATKIIAQATGTAAAWFTPTLSLSEMTATQVLREFTQTPLAVAPNYEATATADVKAVTATAQALAALPFDVRFTVPTGWTKPQRIDANTLFLTDGTAEIFIYRGDAAFFQSNWGIPATERDLLTAAQAVAAHVNGQIASYEGKAAIPILLPPRGARQGVVYLAQLPGNQWVILSASAPTDQLDTYRSEVIEPLLLSLGPVLPEGVPTATPTPLPPPATPTVAPSSTPTPLPTHTRTPAPTFTAMPNFAASATAQVRAGTATASALAAEPLPVALTVPDGWSSPERIDPNIVYLTDGTARIFIYVGDKAFFESSWGIPAGETDPLKAAQALAARVGGEIASLEGQAAIPIRLRPVDTMRGIVYLAKLADGNWLLVSAVAPKDQIETYRTTVFEPLLLSLEVPGRVPPATAMPTPESTPVVLTSYINQDMGLTFDVPDGWNEYTGEELMDPALGVFAVVFFSNPDDASDPASTPTKPALAFLRVMAARYQPYQGMSSPSDFLVQALDVEAEQIQPFGAASYPAARVILEEEANKGAVYGLELGQDDWLIVALVVPPGENILLWDETVLMPVVRSIQVIEVVATLVPPTLTPLPTYTPRPTYTPNPTYTPAS